MDKQLSNQNGDSGLGAIPVVSTILRSFKRLSAVLVIIVVMFIGTLGGLIYDHIKPPIQVVPYEYLISQGKAGELPLPTPGRVGDRRWIAFLAASDVMLTTTWTPGTVVNQTRRFLNRTSSRFFGINAQQLLLRAEKDAKGSASQAFFVQKIFDRSDDGRLAVDVVGRLVRYEKGVEQGFREVTYSLVYTIESGIPVVDSISVTNPGMPE